MDTLSSSVQFIAFQKKTRHRNQTTQCKLKRYNGRPRRDQAPAYLGSPMNHRQIKTTTSLSNMLHANNYTHVGLTEVGLIVLKLRSEIFSSPLGITKN